MERHPGTLNAPLVTDTNDGEAVPAGEAMRWFVAVVRANCERRTADKLEREMAEVHRRPFEWWIATYRRLRPLRGKAVLKDVRLLPGLLFVRCAAGMERRVEWRPDVYKLLRKPGEAAPYSFPEGEFERFRAFVESGGADLAIEPRSLRRGRKVRIVGTALDGYTATVRQVLGQRVRVAAETDIIGDACITVDAANVEYLD